MPTDTSDWPEIYLGYHRFRSPPEFIVPEVSATIGTASLSVLRDQPGTAAEIIRAQEGAGEIVRHITVGEWEVFVTREDMGLVVSSYTFLVLGVRRLGSDVVLTRDSMSRTNFPKADDTNKWLFHSLTNVRPLEKRGSAQGFAFDDLFFETTYLDKSETAELAFRASASWQKGDWGSGPKSKGANSYDLSFVFNRHYSSQDERPLAETPDISTYPGVKVRSRALKVDGADAGFSRVDAEIDGQSGTWFDAAVFWYGEQRPAEGEILVSSHLKFSNDALSAEHAESRALGMLTSIRRER